ncbi:MAG: asparagine synthase (glutamine-hydrolyzing) [Solirubrobacteraceae bacterium]
MCGIAGVFGEVDERALVPVLAAMRHRGPDDEGVLTLEDATLGARRLAIIDPEGGHQPVRDEQGRIGAVLNGEIYNHVALRRDLEARGHQLRSHCDTEVLPHLYEEFGGGMLSLLRGMFAVAVWDGRRRRGMLARDRMGEKPLFYVRVGDRLVFASELRALLRHPGVPAQLDEEAVRLYLTLGYVPGPETIVKGVRKLGPGERLVYDNGRLDVERWWDLVPADPAYGVSARGAAEELRALLVDAVRAQREADVPVGVLLSGGVDSAGIAALMSHGAEAGRVRTFTVGFADSDFDEREPARVVARALGTDHTEIEVASPDLDGLLEVFSSLDEPIADQAALPTYLIAREARRHVTVVLTGEGSDELFGGYPRYRWTAAANGAARIPAPLRAAMRGVVRAAAPGRARHADLLLHPGSPLARRLDWVGILPPAQVDRLTGCNNSAALTLGRLADIARHYGAHGVEADMLLDARTWLVEDVLTKADRMTMAHSLEGRAPYLDQRVVEFATALPAALRLRGREGKPLLRAALRGILPDAVLQRPKQAFRVPVDRWLQSALHDHLSDLLLDGDAVAGKLFERRELERLLVDGDGVAGRGLWALAALEGWAGQVLGGGLRAPAPS